jgi:hypothetical protein
MRHSLLKTFVRTRGKLVDRPSAYPLTIVQSYQSPVGVVLSRCLLFRPSEQTKIRYVAVHRCVWYPVTPEDPNVPSASNNSFRARVYTQGLHQRVLCPQAFRLL